MTRLFISYTRSDSDFVVSLRDALVEAGNEVWLDAYDLEPGEDWQAAIERAVSATDALLFVVSPGSVRSEFCRRELRSAAKLGKPIVAVMRAAVEGDAVPDELAGAVSVDARGEPSLTGVAQRLGEVLS